MDNELNAELVKRCSWCNSNGAVNGVVNDVQWMQNTRQLSDWAFSNGITELEIRLALADLRKAKEALEKIKSKVTKKVEVKKVAASKTGFVARESCHVGFYDSITNK